jgi:acyl carrier protein
MTKFLKRDSLFFKALRIYRCTVQRLVFATPPVAVMGWSRPEPRWKMQAAGANVQDRILTLVKAILRQNAIKAEVHADSSLVDVGLTSMDMVNLMLAIEAEFDFTIPQDEITPENFQSVETLEAMIAAQPQPEQAA